MAQGVTVYMLVTTGGEYSGWYYDVHGIYADFQEAQDATVRYVQDRAKASYPGKEIKVQPLVWNLDGEDWHVLGSDIYVKAWEIGKDDWE